MTAFSIAVILTATTVYFGVSCLRRLSLVANQQAKLSQQLGELAKRADNLAINEHVIRKQLAELQDKLRDEDARRHVAARSASAQERLLARAKKRLDAKNGPVAQLQDAFEDEFGRRIAITSENPRQYDVGPAPSISSDPLRFTSRKWLWTEANTAANAFNELSKALQPNLEDYSSELAVQTQVMEDAKRKWQALRREYDEHLAQLKDFLESPKKQLPEPEEIRKRLQNCTLVSTIFGVSDGLAFMTALPLAISVWLRTALIAGWFRVTRILPD